MKKFCLFLAVLIPAVTLSSVLASSPQSARQLAAAKGKTLFVLLRRGNDQTVVALRQAMQNSPVVQQRQPLLAEVNVDDPAEKQWVDDFDLLRMPLPTIMAFAPNGAITGTFALKVSEAQLTSAFVGPKMADTLLALQQRKLVLLCVQPANGGMIPQGVREFATDPNYQAATRVINVAASDPAEQGLVAQIQATPVPVTVTALLAPPGVLLGKFQADVTPDQLVEALKKAQSGVCGPNGKCGPNGCGPKQ